MPITQDRLIRLMDIATRSLDWSNTIKIQSNRHIMEIYGLLNVLENETDIGQLNYKLGIAKSKLRAIESIFQDYPLDQSDTIELGKEMGHFGKKRAERNIKARNHMRYVRAQKADETAAQYNSSNIDMSGIDMEVEEDLARQWNELPAQKATEPLPAEVGETLRNTYIPPTEANDTKPKFDGLAVDRPAFMTRKPNTENQ